MAVKMASLSLAISRVDYMKNLDKKKELRIQNDLNQTRVYQLGKEL